MLRHNRNNAKIPVDRAGKYELVGGKHHEKDVFLLFDTACIYEIVCLNYFLKFTGSETIFCSVRGSDITSMEGYRIGIDCKISDIELSNIRSLIIPGGDVSNMRNEEVYSLFRKAKERNVIIGGICAGVDILDESGILSNIQSTHSTDVDCIGDRNIVTSRANGYVDFAIEMGKMLELLRTNRICRKPFLLEISPEYTVNLSL